MPRAPKPLERSEPGDWDELTDLLWAAARLGNVPAMRILRDEMKGVEEPAQTPSIIDELATKRKKAAGIG